MTREEKKLWYTFLKRLPLTVKRQERYFNRIVVDFYIDSKRKIIEVDGRQHTTPEHSEADRKRDAALAKAGVKVLRYSNDSVRNQFDFVCRDILDHLGLTYDDLEPR